MSEALRASRWARPAAPGGARAEGLAAAAAAGWLAALLLLDIGAGIWWQRLVGAATWTVLLALLRREGAGVRAQVLAVVCVATCVEYVASPLLGVYTYRLENVPSFVPPGHGLVYLGALCLARVPFAVRHGRLLVAAAAAACGAWAAWGALLAGRRDTFGAVLFVLFVAFVARGPNPLVYACIFAVTTELELLGTAVGTWQWALRDPFSWTAVGNPPSGIAAGYCVLDALGVAAGPVVAARAGALRAALARLRTVPVRPAAAAGRR